ncbi:hypothetical protein [Halorussus salinus]|uniref:hypothetical protein n=1 Tax=Halorussus salinus TaxID=1364935 RepID=UPI0010919A62|nr:hypothetical protein [Halorussus salinus]
MTHAIEFGPDLDDAIPETFDICDDCGTPTVQLSSHTCPDPDTVADPSRAELDRRAEQDPFPDSETVLIQQARRATSYAYHETDANNQPLCPANTTSGFEQLTRTDAQAKRYAPCQFCHRIRGANADNGGDQ